MAQNNFYSAEQSEEVRRRVLAGEKRVAIADAIGRSVSSVGNHVKRLRKAGILSAPVDDSWTEEEDATLIAAAIEGLSYDAMAVMVGRARDSVKHRRIKLAAAGKIPVRKPGCPVGTPNPNKGSTKTYSIEPVRMVLSHPDPDYRLWEALPEGVYARTVRAA